MNRGPVRVALAATAADLIAKRARQAAPNETGGLLLGWWEGTAVVVAHAVEVPDPDATSSRWTRHEHTAQAALDTALRDPSHPWLGYVGDWHSHPAHVAPSPTDELSLRRASSQYRQPLALLVHQPDGHLDLRVAHEGRSRAARLDLTAAAPVWKTTTTCMEDDDHVRAPRENAMPAAMSGEPNNAEPTTGDAAPDLPRFDLRAAFIARQQQLLANLGLSRTVADHPGTLGDATELDWAGMLRAVLPQRYGVTRAFVVDANQRRSEQLDVVIHDRHFSPLLFEVGGARFIPAEGVYAVLEVKQKINKEQVEYAAKKVASVRRLTRTSAPIHHAGGVYQPRPLPRILGGILTLDSDWAPLFGDPLRQALTTRGEDEALDLGCVLRHGSFEAPNPSRPGSLAASDQETAVIFFTLRLLRRLQAMATVPAINYDAYAAAVWP